MSYSALPIVVTGTPIATTWGNQIKADMDETGPAKVTTAGDLLVGTGAGTLGRLAAVAAGQVLKSNGVGAAPVYGQVTPSEVAAGTYAISISGQAATAASATGVATLAQHLLFTDNTYDIGASGATRPRNVYVAGVLALGASPATVGTVRLPSGAEIWARNAAGTGDLFLAGFDGSNNILVSSTGSGAIIFRGNSITGQVARMTTAAFYPGADNTQTLGDAGLRWTTVYATTGTINTSSRAAKRDIAPLDPARALALVRATAIHTFRYRVADPALAGMTRVGFVAEDTDRLLSLDGKSADPQGTASLALAAIQELDRRLSAMEARP